MLKVSNIQSDVRECHQGVSTKVCLFGASADTGNLGVSALCYSLLGMLTGALDRQGDHITVFDEGQGISKASCDFDGRPLSYTRCGAWYSKRLHRPESMFNMRVAAKLGGLKNPGARALLRSTAVLDISGGDSFTDLYGLKRFNSVVMSKKLALENGVPLVLPPQTYGPFKSEKCRRIAAEILRRSTMAWARDPASFARLQELLGDSFDERRHLTGVDVAFGLGMQKPGGELGTISEWLEHRSAEVVGLNVSGLVFNQPVHAAATYGLKADYPKVIEAFVGRLLEKSDARIVLVPHVVTPRGHYESDTEACEKVQANLGGAARGRLAVAPAYGDPREVKWLISQMDWFCGTRMHSTIAGLSSGVPTAALAYSLKTQGVFDTCGQGAEVADLRSLSTVDAIERLWDSFTRRHSVRQGLASHRNGIANALDRQADLIVGELRRLSEKE